MSGAQVYEPQIRARLGTTARFCKVVLVRRALARKGLSQPIDTLFRLDMSINTIFRLDMSIDTIFHFDMPIHTPCRLNMPIETTFRLNVSINTKFCLDMSINRMFRLNMSVKTIFLNMSIDTMFRLDTYTLARRFTSTGITNASWTHLLTCGVFPGHNQLKNKKLGRNVQWFRGGLLFKTHRRPYHSTSWLGSNEEEEEAEST